MYRCNATSLQAQDMFRDIATRINKLETEPEFYHTLSNNCTTNIVVHSNQVATEPVSIWNPQVVFLERRNARLDEAHRIVADKTHGTRREGRHPFNVCRPKLRGGLAQDLEYVAFAPGPLTIADQFHQFGGLWVTSVHKRFHEEHVSFLYGRDHLFCLAGIHR